VLYTDGITEAEDEAGDQYRDERLIRILRNHFDQGMDAMADSVLPDIARFRQTRPPADDMTLLIVRRRG
jgi:sigma-B regulation protein RsbU (phosphoserine phosphatase)